MSCEHCTFGTWFLEKIDHRKKAGEVPLVVVVTVCVDEEREKRAKHQMGLFGGGAKHHTPTASLSEHQRRLASLRSTPRSLYNKDSIGQAKTGVYSLLS